MREMFPCYLVEKFSVNKALPDSSLLFTPSSVCVFVHETEKFFIFFTYLLLKFEAGHFSSQSTDTKQRKFSSLEAA